MPIHMHEHHVANIALRTRKLCIEMFSQIRVLELEIREQAAES